MISRVCQCPQEIWTVFPNFLVIVMDSVFLSPWPFFGAKVHRSCCCEDTQSVMTFLMITVRIPAMYEIILAVISSSILSFILGCLTGEWIINKVSSHNTRTKLRVNSEAVNPSASVTGYAAQDSYLRQKLPKWGIWDWANVFPRHTVGLKLIIVSSLVLVILTLSAILFVDSQK